MNQTARDQQQLGFWDLLSYGFVAMPLAVMTFPIMVYLPTFYATKLGLGLSMVGIILMSARLADVFTDPLIGWLSDRTRLKIGRRRIWVTGGLPFVMAGAYFLLVYPSADMTLSPLYLFFWVMVLYLGWTSMKLLHDAFGAELSDDYHGRSRITTYRESFTLIGSLISLGSIALIDYIFGMDQGASMATIGWLAIALTPIGVALLWRVNEPAPPKKSKITAKNWRAGIKAIVDNRPFLRLIWAFTINSIANGIPATTFLLFVDYVIGRPDLQGLLLFVYFLCGILAMPFWFWLSKKYTKHHVWCYAMIVACATFAMVPLLGDGDIVWFVVIVITTGMAVGADIVLPPSMQADVIDVDRVATGDRRSGIYFALWSMGYKLAAALATGISFIALDYFGFNPVSTGGGDAAGDTSGGNTLALSLIYGLSPIGFKVMAIALVWNFPIDEARQQTLVNKINQGEN